MALAPLFVALEKATLSSDSLMNESATSYEYELRKNCDALLPSNYNARGLFEAQSVHMQDAVSDMFAVDRSGQ